MHTEKPLVVWIEYSDTEAPVKSLVTLLVYSLILHLVLLVSLYWWQARHPARHEKMFVVDLRNIELPAATKPQSSLPVSSSRPSLPASVLRRSLEALTSPPSPSPVRSPVVAPSRPAGRPVMASSPVWRAPTVANYGPVPAAGAPVPFSDQQKMIQYRGAAPYASYSTSRTPASIRWGDIVLLKPKTGS